jgi:hypothetical protein
MGYFAAVGEMAWERKRKRLKIDPQKGTRKEEVGIEWQVLNECGRNSG